MNRDLDKLRAWQQRSRKELKRTPLARNTPIAKKAKRKESWVVVDGVRIFLKNGREECITEAAWQRRRFDCSIYFNHICQCGCGEPLPFRDGLRDFDAHHLKKRKPRDDRIMVDGKPNLVPFIRDHHREEHGQGWSKGELQWRRSREN